jgi:anti-anti-sigma factor
METPPGSERRHSGLDEPAPFAVLVSPGTEVTVAVQGELDIATAPLFEAAVAEIEIASTGRIVLDLRALDFIDVSGLRAVLALRAVCRHASVALTILPGPGRVQRIFELAAQAGSGGRGRVTSQ